MPFYSVLHDPVICPSCGQDITYRAKQSTFFWGRSHEHYWGPGEEVRWLRDRAGVIVPPFTCYRKRGWFGLRDAECNFGSPEYAEVIAFDAEIDLWTPESRLCPSCGARYDHVAVLIRGGQLAGTRVFEAGEVARTFGPLEPFPTVLVLRPDGTYGPFPGWRDLLIG
jgi:hypothetical protein